MTRRQEIAHIISEARHAQLEARGGWRKVEDDAQGHDLFLKRYARSISGPEADKTTRPRTLTDIQIVELRAMHAAKITRGRIAMHFGVSKSTVDYWIYPSERRRQLERRHRKQDVA